MTENRIKLDFIEQTLDINEVINDSLLKCEDEVHHEAICLEIKQGNILHTLGTYKNFSCIVGAQKSRKTFFTCMLMASAVKNGDYDGINAHTFGRRNIYFDTEQAKYHAQFSNRRISVMSGNGGSTPTTFDYYGLRKYSYLERLSVVTEILKRTKNLGLIVIDGIKDLVSSVNDEQQATELIENLMRWTDEFNCHINVIIHLKKGEMASPRGWLGTEIQNKAESVIEVKKDPEFPKVISRVIARDFRGIEFDEFAFEIVEGIPKIIDIEEIQLKAKEIDKNCPY